VSTSCYWHQATDNDMHDFIHATGWE